MLTFNEIKNDPAIKEYIKRADESLLALGYTEHSFAHIGTVSLRVEYILSSLGFDDKEIELAKIAAYMHDIGNLINRNAHSQSGALMAFKILNDKGMPPTDISTVVNAIGNHDEGTGVPLNPISAALIISDKSDVRRSRVRTCEACEPDIHDRVNYSVTSSDLSIDKEKKTITLSLDIDTQYSSIVEYFEIFLERMLLCKKSAESLGLVFKLVINGQDLI